MSELNDSIREYLAGCHYATLATLNEDGFVHQTPVWYLFDEGNFYISTGSSGRKARNIQQRNNTTIMVDSRRNQGHERWVSATGSAEVISGEKSKEINSKIISRYLTKEGQDDPRVGGVFEMSGDATICITPDSWKAFEFSTVDKQYFGGILGETPDKWFNVVD
ncbi:MAG: pyridoxamine 5'-phosphate oxidase family protein [Candidatus Dadabacteria bacterium]|nr:pyridoxamine 5'-phosphate oxidase family protein [Candidatus Dadabacteria bacterium]NIV41191.1 pyridoxamine 5'-phosphate oxidase family protein [Candidatus Dadabacteria bacterium]NIX14480.1 pyridoxamine 5'-phosphate oxidase family protein [Candidatus Dadabacteria bacterium]